MLAKRLVGQLSASDDYEESMISKLKVNTLILRFDLIFFSSKHVVLNTHQNYNECFKILELVKLSYLNMKSIVKLIN